MALVASALASDLKDIFDSMAKEEMSVKDYADELAAAITKHIKTAQVNAGIAVSASGSMGAVAGATTATGTLS